MSLVFGNVHLRLGDMALELDATLGEKVTALFVTSGSGKTSLLELTAGLRRPEQGVSEGRRYPGEYLATDPHSPEAAGYRLRLSASFRAPKHLINEWLRRMAAEHYRSAQLVFGWSFRQSSGAVTSAVDEFFHTTLAWFGEPDPRIIETPWENSERLARLVAHRRTSLVLDGLESLQYPLPAQEGRLRDASLQAFLHELAAFNNGLCVITTRLALADFADQNGNSVLRRDLQLWHQWDHH